MQLQYCEHFTVQQIKCMLKVNKKTPLEIGVKYAQS